MAAAMIVKLPNTTTKNINKWITSLRNEDGAIALGRMLTLVTAPDTGDIVEDSIEAATGASREHPCRIIVVVSEDHGAPEARLDGQLHVGGDTGAGEVVCCAPLGSWPITPAAWWCRSCCPTPRGHLVARRRSCHSRQASVG